ncbi:hypothetical protein BDV95DRAFT_605895 [Massariosphaeria phaeospora]|uniref:Uncharacterized protein n=1 Tax=Massariosphaeria phaeospora TaxID=100035 RepID=A0A7C8MPY3_9PLEO|nr:hypothetical protein BDV95DRAFT_605895 [Massariosphaeria phaeospora]
MRSCHPQWWSRSYAAQEPNYNVPNAATRLTFRNGALRCEFHPPRQTQCLRPAPFDVNGRQLCFRHCYPKEHDNWWTRAQALAEPGYQDWGAPTLRHFTFRQYSRRCEVRIQAGHQCWRPAYFLDRNGVQFCGIVPGHLPRDEGSVDDDGSVDDEGSVDNDDDPNHGGGVGSPKSPGPSSDVSFFGLDAEQRAVEPESACSQRTGIFPGPPEQYCVVLDAEQRPQPTVDHPPEQHGIFVVAK